LGSGRTAGQMILRSGYAVSATWMAWRSGFIHSAPSEPASDQERSTLLIWLHWWRSTRRFGVSVWYQGQLASLLFFFYLCNS
jgi:hypothetical protein